MFQARPHPMPAPSSRHATRGTVSAPQPLPDEPAMPQRFWLVSFALIGLPQIAMVVVVTFSTKGREVWLWPGYPAIVLLGMLGCWVWHQNDKRTLQEQIARQRGLGTVDQTPRRLTPLRLMRAWHACCFEQACSVEPRVVELMPAPSRRHATRTAPLPEYERSTNTRPPQREPEATYSNSQFCSWYPLGE